MTTTTTIVGSSSITVPPTRVRITEDAVLDPTTAKNVGAGAGVFLQKVRGNVLELRTIDGFTVQGNELIPGPSTAQTQVAFFVDPLTGDDSNTGASAADALATWAEYARRVGTGVVLASPFQTVNLLSDLPASDPVFVDARYEGGLVIQGQRTALYSGTVTSAVAWDETTSPVTTGTLVDATLPGTWSNSGPGGTSLIGQLVVMTSGANIGKTGWLLLDLGGTTARISDLIDVFSFTTGTPAPGDTFDVVGLTAVAGGVRQSGDSGRFVNVDSCDVTAAEPLSASGGSVVPSNARFIQTGAFTLTIANATFEATGCLFSMALDITASAGSFFGCSFIDPRLRFNYTDARFFLFNACQKAGGTFAGADAFTSSGGGSINVFSGATGVMDQTAGDATSPNAFRCNSPFATILVDASARAFTTGQTVGVGIRISEYAVASWSAGSTAAIYDFDISGLASEWNIGGTTTTSAVLGAAGTVEANNAGALPQS